MKTSIKSKIIFSFCSLVACVLICQIGFSMFYAKDYFIKQNIVTLESLYSKIINDYDDNFEHLYQLTNYEVQSSAISIVISSEYKYIYSTKNENQIGFMFRPLQLDYSNYSFLPQAIVIPSSKETESVIQLLGKLNYNNEVRYITLTMAVESIDRSISMFTTVSVYINIIILIIGIFITILLARSITSPIISIEKITKRLMNLDFSNKVNENVSTLELESLAKSINSMSNQLESSMTDLKNANEKLQKDVDDSLKLEMMTKQFIASVSHEMKTPIALLQIHCDNLKNKLPGINVDEYYDTIIEESGRLNSIVSEMLNVSNLENGLLKMNFTKTNISNLVSNICKTMEPILDDFNFVMNIKEDLYVYCDEKHLAEAIRNYINNAINHTKIKSDISVTLEELNDKVIIAVYNQGDHILDKHIDKIWQGFYKTSQSRTRENNVSAGLGLYIVKSIVQQHKGECFVKNISNGVQFGIILKKENT